MEASAYAVPGVLFGTELPKVRRAAYGQAQFGNAIVLLFLLAQCLDGIFTYVGVVSFGPSIEANPVVASLMTQLGYGLGVAGAKLFAGALGIGLHLYGIHAAVAVLTAFYLTVAVAPWALVLFF
jgi:hypothetical protein